MYRFSTPIFHTHTLLIIVPWHQPPKEPVMLVKHTGTISPAELFEETKTEMADVEEDYLEMVCVLFALFFVFCGHAIKDVGDSQAQVCFVVVGVILQVSCPPKLPPPLSPLPPGEQHW